MQMSLPFADKKPDTRQANVRKLVPMKGNLLTKDSPKKGQKGGWGGGERERIYFFFTSSTENKKQNLKQVFNLGPETEMFEIRLE
jgi:hypothetical protein